MKETKSIVPVSVNLHLLRYCNYRCEFCFAHFRDMNSLSKEDWKHILQKLAQAGCRKVNFAGGEPLLYRDFSELLYFAHEDLGLTTSIISNGSRIDESWIEHNGNYLDWIGLSCDSSREDIQKLLGRGKGKHVQHTLQIFKWVELWNQKYKGKKVIYKKLNTVVTAFQKDENMGSFVRECGVQRWKILKALHIHGENDEFLQKYGISDEEFQLFVERHQYLQEEGILIEPEDNSAMMESYLMVDPEGRFYQNTNYRYRSSEPILKVGLETALKQIYFSEEKFRLRNGYYFFDFSI